MPTLHLGVIDIPYAYEREKTSKRGKLLKKKLKVSSSITTGEVADILEEKYHLMELFFEAHREQIEERLHESLAGALESVAMGAPPDMNAFAAGEQGVAELFKQFITSGEAERMGIPGTPTEAALKGVSHRKAHPYAKANARRPSFYDTGMYADHFTAWVD